MNTIVKGEQVDLDKIDFDVDSGISELDLPDVFLIKRPRHEDNRGAFQELWRLPDIVTKVGNISVQQSQISSSKPNVIRGFHGELQTKFMTPLSGKLTITLLDLRNGSSSNLNWKMFNFDNESGDLPFFYTLIVPPGVANSLCSHGQGVGMNMYGMSGVYDPKSAGMGTSLFGAELGAIPWPIDINKAIVSDRDKTLPNLEDALSLINSRM